MANRWRLEQLTVNYRTPAEIADVADEVLAEIDPPLRRRGRCAAPACGRALSGARPRPSWTTRWPRCWPRRPARWARADRGAGPGHPGGGPSGAVLGAPRARSGTRRAGRSGGRPDVAGGGAADREAKGLEFDAVVVVEPAEVLAESPRGANDLYVAITRSTQRLAVVHRRAAAGPARTRRRAPDRLIRRPGCHGPGEAGVMGCMRIGVPVKRALTAAPWPSRSPSCGCRAAFRGWAGPAATITPGVELRTPVVGGTSSPLRPGSSSATRDAVFLTYAARCTSSSDASGGIDGCTEPALPLGTPVTVFRTDGSPTLGSLAYSSWLAMQEIGETDPDLCLHNDLALVALDPWRRRLRSTRRSRSSAGRRGSTDGTQVGELVFGFASRTRRPRPPARQGITLGGSLRNHDVVMVPPPVEGDSGSGYLDAGGRAVGLLSSGVVLPVAGRPADVNGVSDLAAALAYASEHGELGRVELVAGNARSLLWTCRCRASLP